MYSGNSEQYWKRSKKEKLLNKKIAALIPISIILGVIGKCILYPASRDPTDVDIQRMLLENVPRPLATTEQHALCETNMRDALRIECDTMCLSEAQSIPRPIMYHSCHHGCSRAIYQAAIMGCKDLSVDETFSKMNQESFNSCSRYMTTDPKPDVQSTCRKYYREGTKKGRQMGYEFISNLIDVEWEDRKSKYMQTLSI